MAPPAKSFEFVGKGAPGIIPPEPKGKSKGGGGRQPKSKNGAAGAVNPIARRIFIATVSCRNRIAREWASLTLVNVVMVEPDVLCTVSLPPH